MLRRTLLKTASLALLGSMAEGGPLRPSSRLPATRLRPVRVEWDAVLKTVVGLRPHRDSGFVLKAEPFGDQTVIHNYGHGGAGMSLAWGCAVQVAELAQQTPHRDVAIIGSGSPGLTAARALQRRGFRVTLYAAAFPPDTTSNMSLAMFTPAAGLVAPARRTPAWDAQFARAADVSYRTLQSLVRGPYGVSWIDTYLATDDLVTGGPDPDDAGLLPARTNGHDVQVLGPGDHRFPTRYAIRTRSLRIEPGVYLDALVADVRKAGARLVTRTFNDTHELARLPQRIVVNCSGLGSRTLFQDLELTPVKGQMTVLAPQREIDYRVAVRSPPPTDPGALPFGMTPRRDGILIGNLQERGNWSLDPNTEVQRRVVRSAMTFFDAMRAAS